ncbi:transporter, CPA2 family [Persephonella hydrogeniphila]|uniref:Transporter, CPA2 family n=1 Tax=Persephonella hydrogeniphila TaxID=198703 RepID=A0A285NAA9_9AQUI|nr:cation:proton antiporter [Persephonella hydrogeniphila]SNZ06424.1 transporter, CPA2 family [Persephonella hydrogeniphila]
MTEAQLGELLLILALLFGLSYLTGGLLLKFRIPVILGALFVGMGIHYTTVIDRILTNGATATGFNFLAQLGVLFLLFYIGLQIDFSEIKKLSKDIVWATVLNTAFPFLFGVLVMLLLGYGWMVAFVIGLTRMPTAEAVIVPILDEFNLIKTRVGSFIVGAGVLDDVIEVFLVAVVSIWIAQATGVHMSTEREIGDVILGTIIFIVATYIVYNWIIKPISKWVKPKPANLVLLSMFILLAFGGFSQYAQLGLVVGAIVAGIIMRPALNLAKEMGEETVHVLRAISYGFFGVVFFLWIGLSVDLTGLFEHPELAILLFLAAFVGKLVGIFLMVPMKKITVKEAWTIGIGLNARLTTEIIVAKLLYDAHLIDVELFTALVAASSVSTVVVPLLFTLFVKMWGKELQAPPVLEVSQQHIKTKKLHDFKGED